MQRPTGGHSDGIFDMDDHARVPRVAGGRGYDRNHDGVRRLEGATMNMMVDVRWLGVEGIIRQ